MARYVVALLVLIMFPVMPVRAADSPDALSVVDVMKTAYARVNDYTATFVKQEMVDGELLPVEYVRYKFKKPFMVYMGWMKGPHEGREALYVRGRNDNQVTGHEGGFLGIITLDMDPNGKTAMKGNRHPITDSGIGRLIEIISDNVTRAVSEGALDISYKGEETVSGRRTERFVCKLPPDRGYYAGRIEMWRDRTNGLPVKIRIYGWDGRLWESYEYRDLVINPGLADEEFSEDYEGYDF